MKRTIEVVGGGRLDVTIAAEAGITRSYAAKLMESGAVLLNGKPPKKSGAAVNAGDIIELDIPEPTVKAEKRDIPFGLIYEDDDLAVIDKPQGLTVHPAGGNYDNTLVNALLYRLDKLSGINGEIRPGIVHRLDKDTSGIMVVAKNDRAHLSLSEQIARRTVKKEYVALLEGNLRDDCGRVDAPIGRSARDRKLMAVTDSGRAALTEYRVITRFPDNCFALIRIHTGRTHQIRVHMKHLGHPVVGDRAYGYKKQKFALPGQLLHAYRLEFTHPRTGERMTFTAPLPAEFTRVYNVLAAKSGLPPFDESLLAEKTQ